MANVVTNKCKYLLGTGLDLSTADIRVLLLKSTGTVTADTNFVTEITTFEADATNYARKTLASETVAEDDTNDWALFDCENITFTSLGGAVNNTIGWVVFYLYNAADSLRKFWSPSTFPIR